MRFRFPLALAVLTGLCVAWPEASRGAGPATPPAKPPSGKKPSPTSMPWPGIVGRSIPDVGVGIIDGGPGTPEPGIDFRAMFEQFMQSGQAQFDRNNYSAALWQAAQAKGVVSDAGDVQRLIALCTAINEVGQTRLRECLQLLKDKKYVEAIKQLGIVSRTFDWLPCATSARKALEIAKSNPEVKGALREVKAQELEAVADRIIDSVSAKAPTPGTAPAVQAAKPAPEGDTNRNRADLIRRLPVRLADQAVGQLEAIVKLYPDTDTGSRTQKDLETLKADKEFTSALTRYRIDVKAKSLLDLADRYRQAGKDDAAAKNLRQVIKEFPNTDWAARAREQLANIRE